MKQAQQSVLFLHLLPPLSWCAAHLYLLFTYEQRAEKEEKTIGIFLKNLYLTRLNINK